MSKVDDMTDQEIEVSALQFHNNRATHPCEHGHPEHALFLGGPCILDHAQRYVDMQCQGGNTMRLAITNYLRVSTMPVYEVQTKHFTGEWENIWHEDDGLKTFQSDEAANEALNDFFVDLKKAGLKGYEREDYRVVRK